MSLGPCDWPVTYVNCSDDGTCSHVDALAPPVGESVVAATTDWLWEATHRRYGNCPVTIRPCLRSCADGFGRWLPYKTTTGWYNIRCGRCGDPCACRALSEVVLPTIGDVLAVEVHGVPMDPVSWRVDNMQRLVRVDGGDWPRCQDLAADPPTWAVTYVPGLAVPEMGRFAAGVLVCQLARRLCGDKCDLPSNTTNVTRQGVTIVLSPEMKTGLWLVDQWVDLANRPVARVHSPDLPVTRTVAATAESS